MSATSAVPTLPEPAEADPAATTLCAAFQATAARSPDDIALRSADGAVELTWSQYAGRVRSLAAALAAAGVGRGDTVALHMSNRVEFHLIDTAAIHIGATPFSIYATSSAEQVAYLFENAQNRIVFADSAFVDVVMAARGERAEPATLVCVDGEPEGTMSFEAFEATGDPDFDFDAAWRAVAADDVLTLIYTSGTTGPPKGVELTHASMLAQCRAVGERLPFRPGSRTTSYLPSAHIADRWSAHYSQIVWGTQVTSVPDPKQVAAILPGLRPTAWGAVPRVFEKLKAALEAGIAADPDESRRGAVQGAIELARKKVRLEAAGEPVPEELAAKCAALDDAVLSKLREKIGLDQAEWVMAGASPLAPDVEEFLLALGLPLTEVYGMSETSCCLTVAPVSEARVGTVGPPVTGVEVKLAEDGELLVRGATIMRGYRNQPEKTAETIDPDGWLATGDVCEIDPDGHIRIIDRKKELIINSAGKNMSPANIEGVMKSAHPLIGQVAVIGDNRPYNVALVVLDPDAAAARAAASGTEASVETLAQDEAVRAEVAAAIEAANGRLARVEQIKRYELLAEEWLPGGDELTPTMKLKRKPIAEKYGELIETLYA
jgi:long-subunit acyl-CoA synthetase (AMP-forming)